MDNNNLNDTTNVVVSNEPKKKGNKGLIIFLILIILGMGGYLTYDKVLKDKKEEPKKTEKVENPEENNKNDDEDKDESINIKNAYVGAYGFKNFEEDIYGELYLREDSSFYYYVGDGNLTSRYVGTYIIDETNNKVILNIKYIYDPNGNYYSNAGVINGTIININTLAIKDLDYNTTNNFVKGAIESETTEHRNSYTINQ